LEKLLLAKEGAVGWFMQVRAFRGARRLALDTDWAALTLGSYNGMCWFLPVLWTPFMVLPVQAALERVPVTLIRASGDLGAKAFATFRHVILPLAAPGVVRGVDLPPSRSTLGDYIVPQIVPVVAHTGPSGSYTQQGTDRNIPARGPPSSVGAGLIMASFLTIAKRTGRSIP